MGKKDDSTAVSAETGSLVQSNITDSEKCAGDTSESCTSSLLKDRIYDSEALYDRSSEREAVLHYIDKLIEDKVGAKKSDHINEIDAELERISIEKQQQREALKNKTENKKTGKAKKIAIGLKSAIISEREAPKEDLNQAISVNQELSTLEAVTGIISDTKEHIADGQEEINEAFMIAGVENTPDLRLDLYIDGVFRAFHCGASTVGNRITKIFRFINNKSQPAYNCISKVTVKFHDRFSARENRLAAKTAVVVDRIDTVTETVCNKTADNVRWLANKWFCFREWAESHKKPLLGVLAAGSATAAIAALIIGNMTAYEYMYNGKVLGVVKDQQDVYKTIDIMGDKLTYAYGTKIEIDKANDISFRRVIGSDIKIDSKDDVLNSFTYLRDMNANAYAITVDGRQVAVLSSKRTAERMLEKIKETYIVKSDSTEYSHIGFAQKVEVIEVSTKIRNIDPEEETLEYLMTGAVEKRTHAIKPGDTFNQVAKDYGLTPNELLASNPDVIPEKLQIGQELVLTQPCPVMTVQTKEITTYTAQIDYDVAYEETAALFKGEQTVKSSGVYGKREVTAEIVRNNGVEVARNELESKVISEPVSQVVLKGTKDLPPLVGTGTFNYPTRGTLTSRFGPRWGRMHYGIDIAAPTGTKIRASDGGTVIYAGRDGALGLVVRINHGANRTTVYGHCSKIHVSVGDKVYQGQHIANVGNTGYSTGPHVHFEVRINGVAQNPLKYLQ